MFNRCFRIDSDKNLRQKIIVSGKIMMAHLINSLRHDC